MPAASLMIFDIKFIPRCAAHPHSYLTLSFSGSFLLLTWQSLSQRDELQLSVRRIHTSPSLRVRPAAQILVIIIWNIFKRSNKRLETSGKTTCPVWEGHVSHIKKKHICLTVTASVHQHQKTSHCVHRPSSNMNPHSVTCETGSGSGSGGSCAAQHVPEFVAYRILYTIGPGRRLNSKQPKSKLLSVNISFRLLGNKDTRRRSISIKRKSSANLTAFSFNNLCCVTFKKNRPL